MQVPARDVEWAIDQAKAIDGAQSVLLLPEPPRRCGAVAAAGSDLQRGPDHQHGADPAAPLARHARGRLLNHYQ